MKNLVELLKAQAIAKREASENAGSYLYETLPNCTLEKVDKWEWEAEDGEIEVVGVKFSDAEGNSMQLNTRGTEVNFDRLKEMEGSICNIRAKLFVNKEGEPEYNGRTTEWSFASAVVTPVIAASTGMVKGGVSPK